MSKLEYNYTVHPDSTHDEAAKDLETKVVATVALTFPNPEFEPARTEKVTSPVMQYEENGEILRDKSGEPVFEDVEQEVEIPAKGKETLNFVQDIFIPADKKSQDEAVKKYCEQYESDYKELVSQPQ
ncbi:hypothetical protein HZA56_14065 [Candidatus Poribacteria bacterium]|nr:hypothetical protein [Candidatus Poribacteria bacterium]